MFVIVFCLFAFIFNVTKNHVGLAHHGGQHDYQIETFGGRELPNVFLTRRGSTRISTHPSERTVSERVSTWSFRFQFDFAALSGMCLFPVLGKMSATRTNIVDPNGSVRYSKPLRSDATPCYTKHRRRQKNATVSPECPFNSTLDCQRPWHIAVVSIATTN